ncbi:hypothetical protein [Pseudomonas sp. NUPR-001]|uniref:hypothetical protein n=1 Tax=Pseudomonas sp. NUPR-001 TaxID=3416058 RepID=UPI003F9E1E77
MDGAQFFKEQYEGLANRYVGLTSDIYLVPPEIIGDGSDLLERYKVEFDEKLYFEDSAIEFESPSEYGAGGAGGYTINFLKSGKGCSAVFINENALTPDAAENIKWLWRYNALHHELMHALDFNRQKNFNTAERTMDLVGAEAFADFKTLQHLSSKLSNGFMKIALKEYASNSITMNERGGIRSKIYERLTKKIDAKTIEHWASISI